MANFGQQVLKPLGSHTRVFTVSAEDWCIALLNLWNEVNERFYGRTSSITRRDVNQTRSVIGSVYVVQGVAILRFPYPFIYLNS